MITRDHRPCLHSMVCSSVQSKRSSDEHEILHDAINKIMPADIGRLLAVSAEVHVEAEIVLDTLSVITRRLR